jgi:hypothetical protein
LRLLRKISLIFPTIPLHYRYSARHEDVN